MPETKAKEKAVGWDEAEAASFSKGLLKAGLPESDMAAVKERLPSLTLRRCEAGEALILEGDEPGDAFVTAAGQLEVFKRTGSRKDMKIAEVGPGTVVGEMALLTGFARSATVKAKDAAEVFVLHPDEFRLLLEASAAFKAKMDALVEERRKALARV